MSWRTSAAPASTAGAVDATALNAFLRAGQAAATTPGTKLYVVMGNEAADLDSIACAIALATSLDRDGVAAEANERVIPLIAIPRDDFSLRADAAWLLRDLGVDVSSLVFLDDLDVAAPPSGVEIAGLTLVDHNALSPRLAASAAAALASKTVLVIDHHDDEKKYPDTAFVTIEPTGSCATLVFERIAKTRSCARDVLCAGGPIATMLFAAVLIDTQNLDPAATRSTPRDVAAVDALAPRVAAKVGDVALVDASGASARIGFYEELKRRRFDQRGLSPRDLLRRDYKQWTMGDGRWGWEVGVASFGVPLTEMGGRGGGDDASSVVTAACDAFARERGLDVLVLMAAFDDANDGGAFARQLAFWLPSAASSGGAGVDAETRSKRDAVLREMIAETLAPALGGLERLDAEEGAVGAFEGRAYAQGDARASRKKLQPAMAARLSETPKPR
jgi:inorganic pyrophosphatase/exopolyphosphatase